MTKKDCTEIPAAMQQRVRRKPYRDKASFLLRAMEVHGDKYRYDNVQYVDASTRVYVTCPTHGDWLIMPKNHTKGNGCPGCQYDHKRLKSNAFIEKSVKQHGSRYDYSKVQYKNNNTPVVIGCEAHGDFEQVPHHHWAGSGCPKCTKGCRPVSEVVRDFRNVHGGEYDYSLFTEYTGIHQKVIIGCKKHGVFSMAVNSHLHGGKCPYCSVKWSKQDFVDFCNRLYGFKYDYSKTDFRGSNQMLTVTCLKHGDFRVRAIRHRKGIGCFVCRKNAKRAEHFVPLAKKVHGDRYDYSRVVYEDRKTPVEIVCRDHGSFWQKPIYHLKGQNCKACATGCLAKLRSYTTDEFIEISTEVHEGRFLYDRVVYAGSHAKVEIFCKKCRLYFMQSASSHMRGAGCLTCREGRSERAVARFLRKHNVRYEPQKTFDGLVSKSSLRYDFYLPDYDMIVEYDGPQHYRPVAFYGGEEAFKGIQERDAIKNRWAFENGLHVVRISREKDIAAMLTEALCLQDSTKTTVFAKSV